MSGAWEQARPSVLLAILTREMVTTKWAAGFRNLALPPHSGLVFKSGAPFDVARNAACADMLEHNFEWLMFLDDDVIPPGDAYARLVRHGKDVVSGLYYRRNEPLTPCAMTIQDGKATWLTNWNPPECLLEVDLVGAGCLLIHRRVLERMRKPWFVWEIGKEEESSVPKTRGAMSEDFTFCLGAKAAGFKIHLDTSIRCEHVGIGQSGSDGYRPSSL